MGLDMHLSAERFIWFTDDEVVSAIKDIFPDMPVEFEPKGLKYEVGYWRKANAIHRWFVANVQNGVDDCGTYPVSRDQLRELLRLCKEISADNTLAESLLPTQGGFFYGGLGYDEFYFYSVEDTIVIIEKILETLSEEVFELTYSSSW
jgi:hypothetical protein